MRVDKTGWGVMEYRYLDRALSVASAEKVKEYYEMFKNEPKIKWKDSFKKILNLESPKEIGLDV